MKLTREQIEAARGNFNPESYCRYIEFRSWFEMLARIATKPIKFPSPARRRRGDRTLPKAA